MRRQVASICALVLLAIGGSACSLDQEMTRSEYIAKTDRIGVNVDRALTELQPADGKQPSSADLREAGESLDEAAGKLEDIDPPTAVAKPHEDMVAGLRGMADTFATLSDDFSNARTDEQRTNAFLAWTSDKDAQAAVDRLERARDGYAQAGYDLFGAAGDSAPA
jgi:hypothetical protein